MSYDALRAARSGWASSIDFTRAMNIPPAVIIANGVKSAAAQNEANGVIVKTQIEAFESEST